MVPFLTLFVDGAFVSEWEVEIDLALGTEVDQPNSTFANRYYYLRILVCNTFGLVLRFPILLLTITRTISNEFAC
jgi:hypothetical protein